MVQIASAADIAAKYARVTPGRSTDYANGVANPKKSWSANTVAAEASWSQGVAQAATEKRFSKGVNKAGNEKWQRKSVDVGTTRWGPGVSAAQDDYASGIAPYVAVIQGITLPARGPKGDPRNIERVTRIAQALHAKKVSG